MKAPTYPAALAATQWERQAGPVAKARGVTLGADLKALERQFGTLDFTLIDVDRLQAVAEAEKCLAQLDGDFGKAAKALCDALRGVEGSAAKVDAQARKDPNAKPAQQAAAAAVRAAGALRGEVEKTVETARPALARRLAELREAALKSAEKAEPDSPERRRLTTRIVDQFRIVKNRPDRKVEYLLCIGRNSGAAYLGPTASDTHRPTLTKALKGDTGFRFYRGECIWEDGGYTFVGPRMSTTLARRIERAIIDLTGTRYRVRAREKE